MLSILQYCAENRFFPFDTLNDYKLYLLNSSTSFLKPLLYIENIEESSVFNYLK